MAFGHIHREEAQHVGDPEDATLSELTGIAPPCSQCKREPGSQTDQDGNPICPDCTDS